MSNRIIWFGNGYGVEYIVTDPYTIDFHVLTEKDKSLMEPRNVIVGTDTCHRNAEIDETSRDFVPGTEESLRDFAVRAREEGISFAEEVIVAHKESLDLSTILSDVLGDRIKENTTE